MGFREFDQTYHNAVRVFGPPQFFHRGWDVRAQREIAPLDTVIFAGRSSPDTPPSPYSYDDSSEPDDPAEHERRQKETR